MRLRSNSIREHSFGNLSWNCPGEDCISFLEQTEKQRLELGTLLRLVWRREWSVADSFLCHSPCAEPRWDLWETQAEHVSFNITQECGVWLARPLGVARSFLPLSLQEKQADYSQTQPSASFSYWDTMFLIEGNIYFSTSPNVQIAIVECDKISWLWERVPRWPSPPMSFCFLVWFLLFYVDWAYYPNSKQELW